jgi:hypothetical protein
MKRVHGYTPDKSAKTPPSSNTGRISGKPKDMVRKRKATGEGSGRKRSLDVRKENASPRIAQDTATEQRKIQPTAQYQARVDELQRLSSQFG